MIEKYKLFSQINPEHFGFDHVAVGVGKIHQSSDLGSLLSDVSEANPKSMLSLMIHYSVPKAYDPAIALFQEMHNYRVIAKK